MQFFLTVLFAVVGQHHSSVRLFSRLRLTPLFSRVPPVLSARLSLPSQARVVPLVSAAPVLQEAHVSRFHAATLQPMRMFVIH
jgi:hypothetical protein